MASRDALAMVAGAVRRGLVSRMTGAAAPALSRGLSLSSTAPIRGPSPVVPEPFTSAASAAFPQHMGSFASSPCYSTTAITTDDRGLAFEDWHKGGSKVKNPTRWPTRRKRRFWRMEARRIIREANAKERKFNTQRNRRERREKQIANQRKMSALWKEWYAKQAQEGGAGATA